MAEKIYKDWSEFKTLVSSKNIRMQYEQSAKFYHVFAPENGTEYHCDIFIEGSPAPVGSDQEDFEDNYKDVINKPLQPKSPDGKMWVMSSSRPTDTYTWFSTCGDNVTSGSEEIGGGKRLEWDFSNTDDDITAPSGFKRKRIEFEFLDEIWIKEGCIYFFNKSKGSYVSLWIVAKDGTYYLDNNGSPVLASGDTKVNQYVVRHPMQGDVPMGDELNTESATENSIPTTCKFWVEVTVPDTDSTSNGVIELECYRSRTMIL